MRVLIMQLNSISIMDLVAYGGAALGIALSLLKLKNSCSYTDGCFFIIMISAEFFLPLRLVHFPYCDEWQCGGGQDFKLLLDTEKNRKKAVLKKQKDRPFVLKISVFVYTGETGIKKSQLFNQRTGITALVGTSGCGKNTITSLLMKENRAVRRDYIRRREVLSDFTTEGLMKKILQN